MVVVRFAVRAMIVVGAILSTGAVIAAVLTDPSGYISDRRAAQTMVHLDHHGATT